MYRCVALAALECGWGSVARVSRALGELASAAAIAFAGDADGAQSRVLLDGRDVSEEIRTPEVSEAASLRGRRPGGARGARRQAARADRARRLGRRGSRHRHGRRARRGAEGLSHGRPRGACAPARARARRRSSRRCSPSRRCATSATARASTARCAPAPGAVTLDTTGLSVEQVVARIVARLSTERRLPAADGARDGGQMYSIRGARSARSYWLDAEGRHRRLSQRGQVLADQPPHGHPRGGRARAPRGHARPQGARLRVERARSSR